MENLIALYPEIIHGHFMITYQFNTEKIDLINIKLY